MAATTLLPGRILKAHAAKHGPLALVQFDAHQDTWLDDNRRIDHGSFVARAARDGIIDPDRSIQIGIRTHAPEDFGIHILYGHQRGRDERRRHRLDDHLSIRRGDPAYLTFDIDCLDPAFAPGTGTPVSGGPFERQDPLGAAAACTSSISGAPTSSRSRRLTTMLTSPPLRGRRSRCICWASMPSAARAASHG